LSYEVNDPAYRCQSYQEQYWDWKTVNDLYAGTRWLRNLGETYLPREPAESWRAYNIRRNKAVLYNATKFTVRGLTGMVFKRDPGESTDIPDKIRADMKNIDLAGTNFNVFCKDAFKVALRDGHCFILVDHQRKDENIVSRLDYEKSGRRPYWQLYTKDQIVNWRYKMVNGETVLTKVTIEENVIEEDGEFGEKVIKQWRVLTPGAWALYKENPDTRSAVQVAPVPTDFGPTSLPYIPLIPIYTNKTGYFESEPSLLDLVYLNLRLRPHPSRCQRPDTLVHRTPKDCATGGGPQRGDRPR
jgi:hypothetical protein